MIDPIKPIWDFFIGNEFLVYSIKKPKLPYGTSENDRKNTTKPLFIAQ